MKTKYIKGIIAVCLPALLFLTSCLKDPRYFDPTSVQSSVAEFPLSGLANFGSDAVTGPGIDTLTFAINVASATDPTTATAVTIGVDNTIITSYNAANPAINYQPIPAAAFKLPATTYTVPAGIKHYVLATAIIDRTQLDPSLSYMLPVKIVSASGMTISGNFGIHYFHVIGNDFAGAYTWDYRRWQNGTGPGVGLIPSLNQGLPPDISTIGQGGQINPISPTEFQMITGYNGQKVMYDVTFTRTVSGGVVTYTNWAVTFPDAEIAKWTAAGIANKVPPAFTIPPPAKSTDPKIFELNYVSGGASGRYIDDTYHK